jgi:uncharacterized membrane protein YqjE
MAETRFEPTAPEDPSQPIDADQSLGDLLSRLTNDFGDLVSTQVQLAKVEIKEEVGRAGRGAGLMTGAGLTAYLAVALLSFAAAWGLAEAMAAGWAFLIVGAIWAVVAGALFLTGRKQLEALRVPPETKSSIKEDVEWARHQRS